MQTTDENINMEGGKRQSAEEMDEERQKNIAYRYLCHLEEAKKWIENCIKEELPKTSEMEEEFRHGVYLIKLASFFAPEIASTKKIFDLNLKKYKSTGLNYRHTDNINYFIKAIRRIGLPKIFYPETYDVYNKTNIPKLVFCIHALGMYLFKLGIAPEIQSLYGKVTFTDEVLSTMIVELKRLGCPMPQFAKIGGILENEFPDTEKLHAAIMAINDAILKRDGNELSTALANPVCNLLNINERNINSYLCVLRQAQTEKRSIAHCMSQDERYVSDEYDNFLTKLEIQGFIIQTNIKIAVELVESAIAGQDEEMLMIGLRNPGLDIPKLYDDMKGHYLTDLDEELERRRKVLGNFSFNQSVVDCILSQKSIQRVIDTVNKLAEQRGNDGRLLEMLNESLLNGTYKDTFKLLRAMKCNFSDLMDYAARLYHEELAVQLKYDCTDGLKLSEVVSGVKFVTAIGYVNLALEKGDSDEIWRLLCAPNSNLERLREDMDYASRLIFYFDVKQGSGAKCKLLTYHDIQAIIDLINTEYEQNIQKIHHMKVVNDALLNEDQEALVLALNHPVLDIKIANICNARQFLRLLERIKASKSIRFEEEDPELWLDDIREAADKVESQEKKSQKMADFLYDLNQAIRFEDVPKTMEVISMYKMGNDKVQANLLQKFAEKMIEVHHSRVQADGHPWIVHKSDEYKVYINVEERRFYWTLPCNEDIDLEVGSKYASMDDLNNVVSDILQLIVQNSFVKFQAICRGYLTRQMIQIWHQSATKIQIWWRLIKYKRPSPSISTRSTGCTASTELICEAQTSPRPKKELRQARSFVEESQAKLSAIVIQRAWRKYKAKMDLYSLTQGKNPSVAVIRKFAHLLQVSHFDLDEELRLKSVQSDIVKTLKHIQDLETDLEKTDIKIGLLVQNRITLQEAIRPTNQSDEKENVSPTETPTRKNSKKIKDSFRSSKKGLKSLNKDSRDKLIGYQHLFYHLQTHPRYLATMIHGLPAGHTTKYMESVIFTLFNYGSNARDHYLLLKVLKLTLEEEIRNKVLRFSEITTQNSLILRIIVSLNRKGTGQHSLREILGPLINEVMADKELQIMTHPVDIYKNWVNQLETTTGKPSGLPYTVTCEEAMNYSEIQVRLMKTLSNLKGLVFTFIQRITSSTHLIPYTMRYMAKVLKNALHNRFPHIPEKDILKAVGHLLYYRYINSAIVAPDAFDIITTSPKNKLTNEQRRNLACIAKFLQTAASNKGFGEEASYLKSLNNFITDCHERFKTFFAECCMVDEPEDVYSYNQFSEATMIFKPTISMTQQEIARMHMLLCDNESIVAPEADDPLHELLQDLGSRPTEEAMNEYADAEAAKGCLMRTEISLSLSSKFEIRNDIETQKEDKDANQKLFNKTKQLLVNIIQCVEGDDLDQLSIGPTDKIQDEKFQIIVGKRDQHEETAKLNLTALNTSNDLLGEVNKTSLRDAKTKLKHNLRKLETRGLVSRADRYQVIMNAVAKDIVQQRDHRVQRREQLHTFVATQQKLLEKESYLLEQQRSYNTYRNACLNNLVNKNKNVHRLALAAKFGKYSKSKLNVRYTAARLHAKGVIVEIEDLKIEEYKNVLFEIEPTAATGIFRVQVKFMGIPMEAVKVDIQDLLQLQYEGLSVKKMFNKVIININLLLYVLNSKFYKEK